ncbi:hypothetical protein TNCV_102251 [Trichonephila clavipes]|nr:hypothetical protein TNCV_102251 [Trichonephila clavipes]
MWLRDPSLSCAHSASHHRQSCNEVTILPRSNSETWLKDFRCLPRGKENSVRKKKKERKNERNARGKKRLQYFESPTFIAHAVGARDVRRLRYNANDLHRRQRRI